MGREEALTLAINMVPRALPDVPWEREGGDNSYDACAGLSYIVLSIAGTGSSPFHIALFHKGTYLGTATAKAYGFFPAVRRVSDNEISVRYTYPRGSECNACASGHATAHFRYDEAQQRVVMTGSVPPEQG